MLICGSILVLMDVGVLIKVLVVGIVMGFVICEDSYMILIDI